MKHINKMLAAALGIFVAFDSNATNARVDTAALDNVITKSYPQHQFGNVLAFQFMQNGRPMIGVLKNGDWREVLPCQKNVIQISINDVMKAACKINECTNKNCFKCYTDIIALNNEHDMDDGAYGVLNKIGYKAFKRLCGAYNNLTLDNRQIMMQAILELPSLRGPAAVANRITNLGVALNFNDANAACRWWMYAMHTEPQFDVLCNIATKQNVGVINKQMLVKTMSSKYEPCESCRQLSVVQNCKQFRFCAVDGDAGFNAQANLNAAYLWNEFSKLLSGNMASTICNILNKKHSKRRAYELVLLNSFEHLMEKLSHTIGQNIDTKEGRFILN